VVANVASNVERTDKKVKTLTWYWLQFLFRIWLENQELVCNFQNEVVQNCVVFNKPQCILALSSYFSSTQVHSFSFTF